VDENRALLGYYAASIGDSLLTFRDDVSIASSAVKNLRSRNLKSRRNVVLGETWGQSGSGYRLAITHPTPGDQLFPTPFCLLSATTYLIHLQLPSTAVGSVPNISNYFQFLILSLSIFNFRLYINVPEESDIFCNSIMYSA
jgi:hypothetical protein